MTKTKTVRTLLALILMVGLFYLTQSTSAQSSRSYLRVRGDAAQSTNSNCKTIMAQGTQVFDPATGIVSGPITNAGILDGNLEDVIDFSAGFVFTPNPTVVSYTTSLTITTLHGQLKAHPITTQSVVTGAGAEWGHIDPDSSTGRFAGATGLIAVVFKPVGDPSVGPYEAQIHVDICFAD